MRGFEVAVRRRLEDYWGFDDLLRFSQARTNAAEPEREFEASRARVTRNCVARRVRRSTSRTISTGIFASPWAGCAGHPVR